MLCLILWIVKVKPDGNGLSVILLCCSWVHDCTSPGARSLPHAAAPATHIPRHRVPFPWAPQNLALKREKRASFALVRTANWKLLTSHVS